MRNTAKSSIYFDQKEGKHELEVSFREPGTGDETVITGYFSVKPGTLEFDCLPRIQSVRLNQKTIDGDRVKEFLVNRPNLLRLFEKMAEIQAEKIQEEAA